MSHTIMCERLNTLPPRPFYVNVYPASTRVWYGEWHFQREVAEGWRARTKSCLYLIRVIPKVCAP